MNGLRPTIEIVAARKISRCKWPDLLTWKSAGAVLGVSPCVQINLSPAQPLQTNLGNKATRSRLLATSHPVSLANAVDSMYLIAISWQL